MDCTSIFRKTLKASRELTSLDGAAINKVLLKLADRTTYEYNKSNGLKITRITVPFGVIGIIYEARPNVTFDVFSLCFKSGNACILKGGSDAINSNKTIVQIIKETLKESGVNQDSINLLPSGREETTQLL